VRKPLLYIYILLFFTNFLVAQTITITGKVVDAATGEGVGFAAVYIRGTTTGTSADFDGSYKLVLAKHYDSLYCTYLGYIAKSKAIGFEPVQVINFALESNNISISEVEVRPRENPAITLIKAANRNLRKYNPDNIDAFHYESFSKLELSVDHIDENLQKRPWFKNIKPLFDSINGIRSEEGKPLLPVFISETVSDYYFQSPPKKHHEEIKASKVTGVGLVDGSTTVQVLGATLQQYNFYDSWIMVMQKYFISPIGDGCLSYYKYYLRDTVTIDNKTCYKIEVMPRRKQDLAFSGNVWISDTSFALMRINVSITKDANLNFIDQIKISQEMREVSEGIFLPVNTRVLIDVGEVIKNTPSFLAKFVISNKDFHVHEMQKNSLFDHNVDVVQNALKLATDSNYWQEHRHEALDKNDLRAYEMVDSLKNIKTIKRMSTLSAFLGTGYYPVGKIDLGPYYYLVNYNDTQHLRVSVGARTNYKFSHIMTYKGYLAYGFHNKEINYSILADFVLSRKKWTNAGVQRRVDLDQAGISDGSTDYNSAVFAIASVLTTLKNINLSKENKVYFLSQFDKDWILKLNGSQKYFQAYFPFAYFREDGSRDSTFTNTTASIELRFAHNERVLVDDNTRYLLGTEKSPIFTLGFTQAFKNVLKGYFDYKKVYFNIHQQFSTGMLGYSYYYVKGAKYFGTVPFPLLDVHPGNQTFYFSTTSFSLMQYYEFVSDEFVSLFYEQHLEGLITNRIPGISKLKWRNVVTFKSVYGLMSQQNKNIIPPEKLTFNTLEKMPYCEISYGIENIFKYFRIDFVHRLTYRSDARRNFGVLVSAQVNL
jgi:hypothetical protein